VDLVVGCQQAAIGAEDEGAVGDLAVGPRDRGRAEMDDDAASLAAARSTGSAPCGFKVARSAARSRISAPVISGDCT
jgi:hypothetical protein